MWPCKQDTDTWLLLSKRSSQEEKVSQSEPIYKKVTTAYMYWQYTYKQANYIIDILFLSKYISFFFRIN